MFQLISHQDNTYFWRDTPESMDCYLDAYPKAPVSINASNIVVSSLAFNNSLLELTVVWDPPSILYGTELVKYEIRIGQNRLAPYEETEQNQYAYVTFVTTVRQV